MVTESPDIPSALTPSIALPRPDLETPSATNTASTLASVKALLSKTGDKEWSIGSPITAKTLVVPVGHGRPLNFRSLITI